jgi:hypothetical protein
MTNIDISILLSQYDSIYIANYRISVSFVGHDASPVRIWILLVSGFNPGQDFKCRPSVYGLLMQDFIHIL